MPSKTAPPRKRKIAIFDIDGTIFRSSLTIELVDALIQEKIFPADAAEEYAAVYRQWLDRKDSYEKYVHAVVKVYNKHIVGKSHQKVMSVARRAASFHRNRVYRYTRDLIRELKRRKFVLIAISHSSAVIVQEFARHLGFDRIYGRLFEIDARGRYTGQHLFLELIDDKAKLLEHLVEKKKWTLTGSVGVGDTESDISFLGMVDKPICFNPNRKLYEHARRQGWRVVVERKDVIYHMSGAQSGTLNDQA